MVATAVSPHPESPADRPPRLGHLGRGALWVLLGRVLGIASTVLVNLLLARMLSPADFGNFVLIASVMTLASCLAMGGQNMAVVRFVAESLGRRNFARARQTLSLVFRAVILGTVVVAALTFAGLQSGGLALLGLPSSRLFSGGHRRGARPVGVSANRRRIAARFAGISFGQLVFGRSGRRTRLEFDLPGFAVAGNCRRPVDAYVDAAAEPDGDGDRLPWALIALRRTARARLPVGSVSGLPGGVLKVRELGLVSLPLLLIQLLVFVTAQSDLWIAGIFCPHDQLALYGAARRLTLLVAMPMQIASMTVLATIAELHAQGRRAELERLLRHTASLAAIPSLGALLLLIVCGGPALTLLFGPFYAQAALPLAILSAGQLCPVVVGCCGVTLEMTGHQNRSLLVYLVAALTFVVAGPLATAWFGLIGLSIASAVVMVVQSIALWWLARVRLGVWTHAVTRFWRQPDAIVAAPEECGPELPQLDLDGQEALVINDPRY